MDSETERCVHVLTKALSMKESSFSSHSNDKNSTSMFDILSTVEKHLRSVFFQHCFQCFFIRGNKALTHPAEFSWYDSCRKVFIICSGLKN